MSFGAADILDNDNLTNALSAQIQISGDMIGTIRKPPIESIVLVKNWGIISE